MLFKQIAGKVLTFPAIFVMLFYEIARRGAKF